MVGEGQKREQISKWSQVLRHLEQCYWLRCCLEVTKNEASRQEYRATSKAFNEEWKEKGFCESGGAPREMLGCRV